MRTHSHLSKTGFTLIELMIVVAIIGIIAAVAIPAYLNYIKTSKTSEAPVIIKGIVDGQTAFFMKQREVAGAIEPACLLVLNGSTGAVAPSSGKTPFAPSDPNDWRSVNFKSASNTQYSYGADVAIPANSVLNVGDSATVAAAGICPTANETTATGAPANLNFFVFGLGNIDDDAVSSRFSRRVGTDNDADLTAGPLVVDDELE